MIKGSGISAWVLLGSVVQPRHTAMHWQGIATPEAQLFLEDAESLLNFPDDRDLRKRFLTSIVRCQITLNIYLYHPI